MRQRWVLLVVSAMVALVAMATAVSALVPATQSDEDRPPIIISSGSVIVTVARGSWTRAGNGQFMHDQARGRQVQGFSATTGDCTVSGDALSVRYGGNAISIGRQEAQGGRLAALLRLPANAAVTARDAQSLVIDTDEPLVSVSGGGNTCAVAGGRITIRQIH